MSPCHELFTFRVMTVVLVLCVGSRINDDPLLAENLLVF